MTSLREWPWQTHDVLPPPSQSAAEISHISTKKWPISPSYFSGNIPEEERSNHNNDTHTSAALTRVPAVSIISSTMMQSQSSTVPTSCMVSTVLALAPRCLLQKKPNQCMSTLTQHISSHKRNNHIGNKTMLIACQPDHSQSQWVIVHCHQVAELHGSLHTACIRRHNHNILSRKC